MSDRLGCRSHLAVDVLAMAMLLAVGQSKVSEDMTRAELNLDAFNDSFLHFVVLSRGRQNIDPSRWVGLQLSI